MVDDNGRAERLVDAMSVSWTKMPDYMAQRLDGWLRAGATLDDIAEAFDYVERVRVQKPVDDPVALMHVRLRGNDKRGGPFQKAGAILQQPLAPPIQDTHDPDAVPPRRLFVWSTEPCAACRQERLGQRADMEHTCGEFKSYAEINRPFIAARRQEARDLGECPQCWGAGFVWSYSARKGQGVMAGGREALFQDQRGVRRLVPCGCQRRERARILQGGD